MHRTRATGYNVRIHHHGRQSSIAIEWVIEVVLNRDLLPSIPTLALCDKPSPHDAAKSPCRMHSIFVSYEAVDSTCR
jgi:hypothetical protein